MDDSIEKLRKEFVKVEDYFAVQRAFNASINDHDTKLNNFHYSF